MAEQPGTQPYVLDFDPSLEDNLEFGDATEGPEGVGLERGNLGQEGGIAPAGSDVEALRKTISELEEKMNRNVERLNGSTQEAIRYRDDVQQLRQMNEQLQHTLQQQQQREVEMLKLIQQDRATREPEKAPEPEISLKVAMDKAYLEGDYSFLERYEQQQRQKDERYQQLRNTGTQQQQDILTRDEVQRLMASQDEQRSVKQMLMQTLAVQHPEFNQPEFGNQVMALHDEISKEPVARYVYPENETYKMLVGDKVYDMRVLHEAANRIKLQQAKSQGRKEAEDRKSADTLDSGSAASPGKGRRPNALFTQGEIETMQTLYQTGASRNTGQGETFEDFVKNRWDLKKKTNPTEVQRRVKLYKAGQWNSQAS